jgi:hypothetical protein
VLWGLACLLSMLSVGITLKTDYKKPKKTLLTSKDTLRLRQSIGLDPNETTKAQWAAVSAPVFSSRRKVGEIPRFTAEDDDMLNTNGLRINGFGSNTIGRAQAYLIAAGNATRPQRRRFTATRKQ